MCITCVPIDDTCSSVKTSVYTHIPAGEQSRGQGQSPELVPATEGTGPVAPVSSSLDHFLQQYAAGATDIWRSSLLSCRRRGE